MKNVIKLIIVFIILTTTNGNSQKLMMTIKDLEKVKTNEQLFVNKPMKILLKEINPKFKMIIGNPSETTVTRLGCLILRFENYKTYFKAFNKNKTSIFVFVKENFEWDFRKSKKKKWSKKDLARFEGLTVVGIGILVK